MHRIFLAFGFLLTSLISTAAGVSDTLTVMSYNIRNAIGMDNVRNYGRTAAVITAAKPDVVTVLEVDSMTARSNSSYVLGELATRTGLHPTYSPAIDYDGGRYGIGILSAEKPISVTRHPLPGREEARTIVIAEFPSFIFAATHLSLTAEDALESASIINRLTSGKKKPVIIAGDFNVHPDSETIARLCENFTMVNAPAEATFPADKPNETIDYIMLRGAGLTPISCEIINAPVESDHRPITAKFLIKQ